MIYDLGVLLRLIRLRLRRKGIYWLKVLGISQNESLWFYLYVLAYAVFWVTVMWSFLADSTYRASQQVPVELLAALHTATPIVWLVLSSPSGQANMAHRMARTTITSRNRARLSHDGQSFSHNAPTALLIWHRIREHLALCRLHRARKHTNQPLGLS